MACFYRISDTAHDELPLKIISQTYFHTLGGVPADYHLGTILQVIRLPTDDVAFHKIKTSRGWVSNAVIIESEYSLFQIKTYEKFGLNIRKNHFIVNHASCNANMEFLNWWLNSGLKLKYTECAMDQASVIGRTNVLDWWLKSGFKLKYTDKAIDSAIICHQEESIKWWITSGLPLKCTKNIIEWASENGHLDILKLWLEANLPFEGPVEKFIKVASKHKQTEVVEWFQENGFI